MKHQYDWSKLDTGWECNGDTLRYSSEGETLYGMQVYKLESILELEGGRHHPDSPLAQLAKCRVIDNTPLFEAMDKMAKEAGAEEWAKVPSYQMDYEPLDYVPPQGDVIATLSIKPPWRRGPLATWTLVNISCHDGRLTVVMKRGRGELVMETGPDDEALWERLGAKVVDIDKAKAKAAAEAKEKSDDAV